MLAETCFVEDKNFLKFQQEHAQAIQEMYGHGLLAGKYLKPTGKSKESALKRNLKRLQKEGVK